MKRLYLIILLATVTLSGMAQTIGEAFYIYRNDGQFNAFFRDEVDSIAYSHYDADSVYYDENVTQLVYTADSLYRIPLAAIDSVGFVTPKNICKPEVKVIDSLADLVLYSDSNSFVLSSTTPQDLIPMVGDKILTTERTVGFPNGFAGEVTSIETVEDGVKVACAEASITDFYDVFFGYSQNIDYTRNNFSRREIETSNSNIITISPGRIPLDLRSTITGSYSVTEELSLSFTPDLAFEIEPIWKVSGFVIFTPKTGLYASAVCVADYYLKERLGGAGKLTFQKDFPIPIIPDRFPIVTPWLFFYPKIGAFFRADFTIAAKWEWSQHYRQVFVYEYSSKGKQVLKQPYREPRLVDSSHSEEGLLNGAVALGGFAEVGLTLVDKRLDRIAIRGEYGWEAEAQAVLYKRDFENASHSTALYNQMRGCGFAVNKFWNVSVQVAAGPWGVDWTPLHDKTELWRMSYVPEFSNVNAHRNSNKAQVSGNMSVSGNCQNPVEVGMTLVDEEDNQLSSEFEDYPNGQSNYQFCISNTSPQKHYTMYPTVRAWDYTMLAEPTCEVEGETSCPDSNHPHMIDLGLPSGTKWACCNVGAYAPEQYGGYFEFGETSERTVYSPANENLYWESQMVDRERVEISDIAGTSYDVATVRWGSPWCTPSLARIKELLNHTTTTGATLNGVEGCLFTGTNGNAIFLPLAGNRWFEWDMGHPDYEFYKPGVCGLYWSSTIVDEENAYYAYDLDVWSGAACQNLSLIYCGQSVRPVCSK